MSLFVVLDAGKADAYLKYNLSGELSEIYLDNFYNVNNENFDPGRQPAWITTITPSTGAELIFPTGRIVASYALGYSYINIEKQVAEYEKDNNLLIDYMHHSLLLKLEAKFAEQFKLILAESIEQDTIRYDMPDKLFHNQADINRLEGQLIWSRRLSVRFTSEFSAGFIARRALNPSYRSVNANISEFWGHLRYKFLPRSFMFFGAKHQIIDMISNRPSPGVYTPDRRITSPVIGFESKVVNGLIGKAEYNYQIVSQQTTPDSKIEENYTGHWFKGDLVFNYFHGNETTLFLRYAIQPDIFGVYYRRLTTGGNIEYTVLPRWKVSTGMEYQQYQREFSQPQPGRRSTHSLNRTYTFNLGTNLEFLSEKFLYAQFSYFNYIDGESDGGDILSRILVLGIRGAFW